MPRRHQPAGPRPRPRLRHRCRIRGYRAVAAAVRDDPGVGLGPPLKLSCRRPARPVDASAAPCSYSPAWIVPSGGAMRRLRTGLLGAGLVGQAAHAFYLWEERERFEFAALADASPAVRKSVGGRYGVGELHAGLDGLLGCGLEALVIAAPDAFHPALAAAALNAGLHVMCEKPLALTLAGCDKIAAARDRSGRVLQVAYMKRYDPAYRRALDLLPARIEEVQLISVEVNDPDQGPFVAHLPMTAPDDLPAALKDETREMTRAQLREAAGTPLGEAGARALANGFLSALVHDVAVVHGMLARLGVEMPAEADHGSVFADGYGEIG